MRKITKVVGSGVAGLAVAAGTFAFAQFGLQSAFDGSTNVATASNPTAHNVATTDALWPGSCSAVSFSFKNDNPKAVVIDNTNGSYVHGASGDSSAESKSLYSHAKWQADDSGLAGTVVAAGDEVTLTIPGAVCVSPDITNADQGQQVFSTVVINSHVQAGTDYKG